MRKGTLSLILAVLVACQGVLLCACKRKDTGYFVTFGNYGGRPIRWIIIDQDDDTYYLVSQYILDMRAYDENGQSADWESSSIRKWLNEDFYEQAFNQDEKARIVATVLGNRRPRMTEVLEEEKKDQVFLLSSSAAQNYFMTDAARKGKPENDEGGGNAASQETWKWWLIGPDDGGSSLVDEEGRVAFSDASATTEMYGVRPAVVITTPTYEQHKANEEWERQQALITPTIPPRETALEGRETVRFGSYAGSEIEWVVLDKEGDYTLLMARCVVASVQYGFKDEETSWDTCYLNQWLNNDFFYSAFDDEELARIKSPSEVGEGLGKGSSWAGMDTTARVFLLSSEEVEIFFPDQYDRVSKTAEYTNRDSLYESDEGFCVYWLRSCATDKGTYWVNENGRISYEFNYYDWVGVRPVIWVKL
ncbi:MAG: hypothetical protein J5636_03500 [Clostridiales bacterium]|nr:hypothetical protein [Clostridiales bacterium]